MRRAWGGFVWIACFVFIDSTMAFGGEPPKPQSTTPLELPKDARINLSSLPEDPALLKAIRTAIEGRGNTSGQPLFEDLYRVIESRGSVLQGSELEKLTQDSIQPGRVRASDVRPRLMTRPLSAKQRQEQLRAAESLIKTARMIDKLAGGNQNRDRLVNDMLREAVSLLSRAVDSPTESSRPVPPRPVPPQSVPPQSVPPRPGPPQSVPPRSGPPSADVRPGKPTVIRN